MNSGAAETRERERMTGRKRAVSCMLGFEESYEGGLFFGKREW